jgi:hypothetical protein
MRVWKITFPPCHLSYLPKSIRFYSFFARNESGDLFMDKFPIPPRGIFIPTRLIFHPELPAAALVTWIQLCCLAWRGWHAPPFSLPELASLTGIHPARLERHLSQLEAISALSLHPTGDGKLIISFPEHPGIPSKSVLGMQTPDITPTPNTNTAELAGSPSYFPRRILGYISYAEEQEQDLDDCKTESPDTVSIPGEARLSEYLLFRY